MATTRDLMTREEVLARLNIKPATLYSYVSRGLIGTAPHDDGRRSLYLRADVERVGSRKRGRISRAASAESTMRWGEPVLASAITHVTPEGPLYRNRSAVEMARSGASFESVSQLLMTGVWQDGVNAWGVMDTPASVMPLLDAYAHKLGRGDIANLLGMVPFALGMQGRGAAEISDGGAVQAARLVMQTMGGCLGFLSKEQSFLFRERGESLAMYVLRAAGGACTPDAAFALNGALIALADNELAPATFAARVAASTNADLYTCIAAAIGSHVGFSTGTVTETVETLLLGNATNPDPARRMQVVREVGVSLLGFNHPLYPGGDARAALILEQTRALENSTPETKPTLDFLALVEDKLGMHPGVAVALVVLCRALGLPDGTATAAWIISRTAGWVAHVLEQRSQAFLLRPRARYIAAVRM
jgi:citrate synthase